MPTSDKTLSTNRFQQFSLFRSESIERLEEAIEAAERRFYAMGEVICKQGEEGRDLYLLHRGEVRVIRRHPDSSLETLGNLGPGDCFGEISVLTGDTISADVITAVDSEVFVLDGERFRDLCERDPLLSRGMGAVMSVRLMRNVPVFESCSDDLLCEVMEAVDEKTFERGDLICKQGTPGGYIYLIKSGQVRVTLGDGQNREEVLGYLGPGDHFGEMSVLTGEPVSANVAATMRTRVFALRGREFEAICEKNPVLYKGISRTLSIRLREANQRKILKNLGTLTRVCPDCPECDPSILTSTMAGIANQIWHSFRTRQLCLLPLPPKDVGDEEAIRTLGRIPGRIPISFGLKSGSEEQKQAILFEVAGCLEKTKHEWYRVGNVDLLTLAMPGPGEELAWEHRVEETISLMKPIYSQILFLENVCRLETVLEESLPEEAVTALVDLTDPKWQTPAEEEDFIAWVPEGNRCFEEFPGSYWVLSEQGKERFSRLGKTVAAFPDRNVRVVVVHHPERPILDYGLLRKLLGGAVVDILPFEERWYRRGRMAPPNGAHPSMSILKGRNPTYARACVGREMSGNRIGLALGGGGARGMAHVGVIKTLLEEGIPIDIIAGSSMGAVVAAAFAEGRPPARLLEDMRYHWDSLGNFLLDIRDYTFPRTNLLRGRKIRRMIEVAMKESRIEETQVPIYVVCTDLITGQEVVLSEGHLGEAIRASGSLPGIFKPTWWDGHLLVDGAVLNKVPAKVLKEKGAKYILAVNVTPERETKFASRTLEELGIFGSLLKKIPGFRDWAEYPNIFKIIMRSLSVSGLHQSRSQKDLIDIEIKPKIEDFDFLRFDQFEQLVEAGAEATRQALPEIRRLVSGQGS